jgi:hypothetical protein
MTLTLNISGDAEETLRQRASAEGKDPSQYAAEIVERALSNSPRRPAETSEEEKTRLRAAASRLLEKAREMAPTLSGPVVTDFDKAFEEIMRKEAERQGLKF